MRTGELNRRCNPGGEITCLPHAWPPGACGSTAYAGARFIPMPVTPIAPDPKARLRALADEIGVGDGVHERELRAAAAQDPDCIADPGTFGKDFQDCSILSTLAYLDPSEYPAPLHTESAAAILLRVAACP